VLRSEDVLGVATCSLEGESLFRCKDGEEEGEIEEGRVYNVVIY
jgi:hypothetical protein